MTLYKTNGEVLELTVEEYKKLKELEQHCATIYPTYSTTWSDRIPTEGYMNTKD